MFEAMLIWPRDLEKKIGVEVFGELWNMVLEENGEDKLNKFLNI